MIKGIGAGPWAHEIALVGDLVARQRLRASRTLTRNVPISSGPMIQVATGVKLLCIAPAGWRAENMAHGYAADL